ncbi:2,3-bisphosphoglycerate-dependent phosphoglycerate mutase [Salana multivorans]|uniref:2,3-bisphosphoglycerate-dependent phosphoglycerate mutase n=1 Tax=Salana multivorans TaxID=120377 RepID=A0A3N2D1V8_9MICO|nr:2,3-diphosphoglycerate-dependent phosphoglycerate mutase [Salana multivorans]MBN8883297.1 2,3-diphosphoglycerate-dependent phosphoglycerate mutase [Salana multivorans]ROR93741.1 2,3-bisphosphoglycerate-dependent phosphoglycerate mutase [Salana multivorans]
MNQRRAAAVLLRHGESTANAAGLFTGVLDVPLSQHGMEEARVAAGLLRETGLRFDAAFCSELARAWQTADVLAEELPDLPPFERDWRLDERNYGGLTTLTKADVKAEHGEEQFLAWRRSVRTPPPPMGDELYDALAGTDLFRRLPPEALVRTESLADVMVRVRAFWLDRVDPLLRRGGNVLVVAHGNSLRALCAVVDRLPDAEIRALGLPTGHPLLYEVEPTGPELDGLLVPLVRGGVYLDEASAHAAAERLALEGGT